MKRHRHLQDRQLIETIFDGTQEALFAITGDLKVSLVNHAFLEITGYDGDALKNRDLRELIERSPLRRNYLKVMAAVRRHGSWSGEVPYVHASGRMGQARLSINEVAFQRPSQVAFVGVVTNLGNRRADETQKTRGQHLDELTLLPTRKHFREEMRQRFLRMEKPLVSVGLVIIDIERFREINEGYSHSFGDALIRLVAQRLVEGLPSEVTIARIGVDEFALLSSQGLFGKYPLELAQRAQSLLHQPFRIDSEVEISISTFAGTSSAPQFAHSPEELLQQASAALDRAKRDYERCVGFNDGLLRDARNRQLMEQRLREVIQAGRELEVYYQPQVDIRTRKIVGAEALLRWRESYSGQMIPMDVVIPLAERTGLIASLGEWVLTETCRQGAQWIADGIPPLSLAVNVSAHQMRHGDFPATVRRILDETGFPPSLLEIELTESSFMINVESVAEKMAALRAMGVRIALDDFGTGYSSLSHLKKFPVSVLKIDKHFVDDVARNEDDRSFTSTIINMGHALGLSVLAEGVEDEQQLEVLERQGCDMFQGFYTSKPVCASSFTNLLLAA